MKEYIHKDKNRKKWKLNELTDSHLRNIINYINKKAVEGLSVTKMFGCMDFGYPSDFDMETSIQYGNEAKETLHYSEYINEQIRRSNIHHLLNKFRMDMRELQK